MVENNRFTRFGAWAIAVAGVLLFAYLLRGDDTPPPKADPEPTKLSDGERELVRVSYTQYLLTRIKALEALTQDKLGVALQKDEDATMNAYSNLVASIKTANKLDAACQMDIVKLEFACPTKK